MTLDGAREKMAEFLREKGIDAVCAWPDETRVRRQGAAAAVSLRRCEAGPSGLWNYLGERYNRESGRWEELYGRRVKLTFGLDLYAPKGETALAAFDRLAGAFHQDGPEGLEMTELAGGDLDYDGALKLFRMPVEAVCKASLCAAAGEGGVFEDFDVRGAHV